MKFATASALALLAATMSLSRAQDHNDHSAQPAVAPADASKAYTEANTRMMEAMHGLQPSGDPDRDFVTMMIPHHQGAIDMARIELQYGKDSELRAMAEKIIADQEREIAEMKDWLSKR
jgi:uncharacterized protein (DUF305 family)